jgi:hypothetical protein
MIPFMIKKESLSNSSTAGVLERLLWLGGLGLIWRTSGRFLYTFTKIRPSSNSMGPGSYWNTGKLWIMECDVWKT